MRHDRVNPMPHRVLMSVDAVGGIWRYAIDLAAALRHHQVQVCFVGLGPLPTSDQKAEAQALGEVDWLDEPLDWMVQDEAALRHVPRSLSQIVGQRKVDLLHLNLPSQASGLDVGVPVVVVSHSCVVTWFSAVRASAVPSDWRWQQLLNAHGFDRADAVLAPSGSHAAMLERAYGRIRHLQVVYNASAVPVSDEQKEEFVFAAGRWWDEGKNGAVLDAAASQMNWPLITIGAENGPSGQLVKMSHTQHYGMVDYSIAMALMRRASILVSPSVYEPFGLAALEAARSGSALVLADNPTYRELWDGAAVFADPQSPAAFAEGVNRLAGDARLRARMADEAKKRSQQFTADRQAASMARLYSSLLDEKRKSTAAE